LGDFSDFFKAQSAPDTDRGRVICKYKVEHRRLIAQQGYKDNKRLGHDFARALATVGWSSEESSITYLKYKNEFAKFYNVQMRVHTYMRTATRIVWLDIEHAQDRFF
jgi:hypothetical protein